MNYYTSTGWAPQFKEQAQAAITECLKVSADCSKGPWGPIGSWDVSALTDTSLLFYRDFVPGADKYSGDISEWDVSRVTTMSGMFHSASSFNADISKWDVSKVNNMARMFYKVLLFNADISKWDVSKVTDMAYMFYKASSFNADISKWDVTSVTNMPYMFYKASSFNGDISKWDVVRATNMHHLLDGASSFAGTLCGAWVASSTADRDAMLDGSSGRLCTTSTTSSKTTRASPKRKNPRHVFDAVQCLTSLVTLYPSYYPSLTPLPPLP